MQLTDKQRRSAYGALAITASLSLVLTGCQDEDFGYSAEDIKYEKAYKDFFGDMPADKSWDLSSYTGSYDPANTRANTTIIDGDLTEGDEWVKKDQWWEVPQRTYDWMLKALLEGKDNRYLGSNFVLQLPENDFVIIPIFQGKSSIMSELEVKINGYAIKKVWSRSENIQVKDTKRKVNGVTYSDWQDIGYYDGYSGYDQATMKKEWENAGKKASGLPKYPSYTDEAEDVRAKPIYFRTNQRIGVQDHGFMYLSLHNIEKAWASWTNFEKRWDENNEWTTTGHRLTSVNPQGHMLALNVPFDARPSLSNLPKFENEVDGMNPSQMLLIACEDANGTGTDHDVNDVAFLIIGYPNVPTVVPTTEIIKKRYMCEDLGGDYDYDFNDVVVDCTQKQNWKIDANGADLESYEEGVADKIEIKDMIKDGCPVQTAKISRLCGTLPVCVRIGDFVFPWVNNPTSGYSQDGKYWTRRNLIEQSYFNLCNGQHERTCQCERHSSYESENNGSGHKVGHQDFTRAEGNMLTYGWNPNEEQIIPHHTWDPQKNNIIIYANWGYRKIMYDGTGKITDEFKEEFKGDNIQHNNIFGSDQQDFADFANGKIFPVTFPKTGKYPYIIATDPEVPWMNEDKTIPASWITGDFSDLTNADLIGNSFYMEGYPKSDGEGFIWSGDVTGIAYSTGLAIKPQTAEMAAIAESQDAGRRYYLLNVYVEEPVGEIGRIGLLDKDWNPLFSNGTDGYLSYPVTQRLHQTYLGVNGLSCVQIYLTPEQWNTMRTNGFVIASRTNGLRIKKVSTSRPCLYDGDTVETDANNTVLVDPGFTVEIPITELQNQKNNGEFMGMVMSNESERIANLIKAEEGKELTAAQVAANTAEPGRVLVPFEKAQFISGTRIELTARGNKGYKLVKWNGVLPDGATATDNPLIITHTYPAQKEIKDGKTVYSEPTTAKAFKVWPTFVAALDPNLRLEDGGHEITITLANNGKYYDLPALSENMESELSTFGLNEAIVKAVASKDTKKHYLRLTPQSVGETTFIVYQKEGKNNDYGVSGELKITVKVIDTADIPTANSNLAGWMVHWWNSGERNAYIVSNKNINNVNKTNENVTSMYGNNDPIFGHPNGHYRQYVDFPNAKVLIIEVNSGDIEVHLNKHLGTSEYPDFAGERLIVSTTQNTEYCHAIFNGGNNKKTYIIDLAAIRQRYGYVHLNSICSLDGKPANVASMKVDSDYSEIRGRWGDINKLQNEIHPATLNVDVNDIYQWNNRFSLTSEIIGQTTSDYVFLTSKQENGTVVFGQKDSNPDHAVDLSTANTLKVTANKANSNGILFQFNKTGWSNRLDVKTEDWNYVAAVEDGTNIIYLVDLDKVRQDNGVNYLYLAAINADFGHSLQISKIEIDSKGSIDVKKLISNSYELAPNKEADYWQQPILNQETSLVCGLRANYNTTVGKYDDMDGAKYLKVTVKDGYDQPRFFFNYVDGSGNDGITLWGDQNSPYILTMRNDNGTRNYYIDLGKLRADKGHSYLNAVAADQYKQIVVTEVKVGLSK